MDFQFFEYSGRNVVHIQVVVEYFEKLCSVGVGKRGGVHQVPV